MVSLAGLSDIVEILNYEGTTTTIIMIATIIIIITKAISA